MVVVEVGKLLVVDGLFGIVVKLLGLFIVLSLFRFIFLLLLLVVVVVILLFVIILLVKFWLLFVKVDKEKELLTFDCSSMLLRLLLFIFM